MATTRLLRSSKALHHVPSSPTATANSSVVTMKCKGKADLGGGEKMVCWKSSLKASAATSGNLITIEPTIDRGLVDLVSLIANISNALLKVLRSSMKRKLWELNIQMLVEKVIIDCRFFTLFAVGGSLLGSILCFVEGCFLIMKSYLEYFNILSRSSDEAHIIHLLMEAIDMFLVGTAMLLFGVGLYVLFVGSKSSNQKGPWLPGSNLFGLFHLKSIPTWVETQSVTQAKSRIGHSVLMILQVGVIEKFKNVPLTTSFDLACFAAAVFVSSACIFLLSKLSVRVGGGIMGDTR